ncbi:MAG: hypothetical protein ABJE66_00315 [Deltaproteobacteria bacterium]
MSAIVHTQFQAHVQVRSNVQVAVRDHRVQPTRVVRREPARQTRPVRIDRDDRGHTRDDRGYTRRVIVHPIYTTPAPVYVSAPVYTSWTPAPSYTYQPAAIQLLGPTALANDQLSINVGSLGNATTLELDAAGGSTFVSQVTVISANGAYQTIPVNQMLSAQNPSIPLSIDNYNSITRIVVDGHSEWGGALSIRAL